MKYIGDRKGTCSDQEFKHGTHFRVPITKSCAGISSGRSNRSYLSAVYSIERSTSAHFLITTTLFFGVGAISYQGLLCETSGYGGCAAHSWCMTQVLVTVMLIIAMLIFGSL